MGDLTLDPLTFARPLLTANVRHFSAVEGLAVEAFEP